MLNPVRPRTAAPLRQSVALICALLIVAVGCSRARTDSSQDAPGERGSTSIVLDLPTVQPPPRDPPVGDLSVVLAERLLATDSSSLVLGADVNVDFLAIAFRGVGLTSEEARCAAQARRFTDPSFDTAKLGEIISSLGSDPDSMRKCVTPERLAALTASGGTGALDDVPENDVRMIFGEVLVAQYMMAGLSRPEATCTAFDVISYNAADDLEALFVGLDVTAQQLGSSLEACLKPARMQTILSQPA